MTDQQMAQNAVVDLTELPNSLSLIWLKNIKKSQIKNWIVRSNLITLFLKDRTNRPWSKLGTSPFDFDIWFRLIKSCFFRYVVTASVYSSNEQSGKNKIFGFFLLGFKYTLRTCFESKNTLPKSCPELSNQVLSFSEGQIY